MVGSGDFQGDGSFDPGGFGGGLGFGKFGGGTGKNDLAAPIEVRDFPARFFCDLGGEGFVCPKEGEHGALGLGTGFLHQGPAPCDETKAVFCGEGPGRGVSGKFSQGEAGGCLESEGGSSFSKKLEKGQSVEVKCGLAVGGASEDFFGSFLEDFGKMGRERFGSEMQDGTCGGRGSREVRSHADALGALTGEKKSDGFHF